MSEGAYELFTRGTRLLEDGDFHAATVPLARARDLEPDKTSIREALGRALFRSQRYEDAVSEFSAVVERAPTNDFALFCLGRSLQLLGRHEEARQPSGSGVEPAARAGGLPEVPGPGAQARRLSFCDTASQSRRGSKGKVSG